jgi:hypothetical protein
MSDTFINATDYKLENLELVPKYGTGEPLDIADVMLELHFYEDIYQPFMTGHVVISDAGGMPGLLPITGEEDINISIKSPGEDPIELEMRVFRMDQRRELTDVVQQYTLHFCSKEMVKNAQTETTFGFKGELLSDMAQSVYDQFLTLGKDFDAEPTLLPHQMVSANFPPAEFLMRMSNRAQSATYPTGSDYFFWEDRDGFHFRSIQSLMVEIGIIKDAEEREIVKWQVQDVPGGDEGSSNSSMRRFTYGSDVDAIERMVDGTLGQRLISFDPIKGEVKVVDKTATEAFGEVETLDTAIPFSPMAEAEIMKPEQAVRLIISNISEEFTNNRDEFLLTQRTQSGLLRNSLIDVELPGNTFRKLGDVVDLRMPAFNHSTDQEDEFMSSNALITCINHAITKTTYIQTIQLAKDSFIKAPE